MELKGQGQTETFGGSRLSRTSSVWEIKFEKRGPMGIYSVNLDQCSRVKIMLYIKEEL